LIYTSSNWSHIIAASSFHHFFYICLQNLEKNHGLNKVEGFADPTAFYRETCQANPDHCCLKRSPNLQNHFYMRAAPLGPEVTDAIYNKEIYPDADPEIQVRQFSEHGYKCGADKAPMTFEPDRN